MSGVQNVDIVAAILAARTLGETASAKQAAEHFFAIRAELLAPEEAEAAAIKQATAERQARAFSHPRDHDDQR